jgi:hypothetical protein
MPKLLTVPPKACTTVLQSDTEGVSTTKSGWPDELVEPL